MDIIKEFWANFIDNLQYYALIPVPFFVLFWILIKKYVKGIRIQEVQKANPHHFRFDFAFSMLSLVLFSLFDMLLLRVENRGFSLVYESFTSIDYIWIPLSLFIALFIDDAFFYWSHRFMHHPRFYKIFHKVHHESTDPSPLTALAFHPTETVFEYGIRFILPFVMPMHISVLIFWQLFSFVNNSVGHLGYEIYPKWWKKIPFLKWKTTSTHHNMHHELFNGNYALYFTWWDKWIGTEFKDYETRFNDLFERKNIQKTKSGLYLLEVSEIKYLVNDAFTIRFDSVPNIFKTFRAGQHLTIKVNINNKDYHRTFSISSVPLRDEFMTLTIKKIKDGLVTNYLAENLRKGDMMEVTAPSGQFCIDPEPSHKNHYVMIAGGSGITPIHSMIGNLLKFEPQSKITLLYANRDANNILFKNELNSLVNSHKNNFEIQYFLSDINNLEGAISGYVSAEFIEKLIANNSNSKLRYYLCGPALMTQSVIETLQYIGIDEKNIHQELFFVQQSITPDEEFTKANVTATLYNKKYTFEVLPSQTILQAAIQQNIPLPSSCQSGLCGMCKMKCTGGEVKMNNRETLSDNEYKNGYILTCQSHSLTNQISLKK